MTDASKLSIAAVMRPRWVCHASPASASLPRGRLALWRRKNRMPSPVMLHWTMLTMLPSAFLGEMTIDDRCTGVLLLRGNRRGSSTASPLRSFAKRAELAATSISDLGDAPGPAASSSSTAPVGRVMTPFYHIAHRAICGAQHFYNLNKSDAQHAGRDVDPGQRQ